MQTTTIQPPSLAPVPGVLRRLLALVAAALFVALVVVWLVLLRPQALGGATDYVIVSGGSMDPVLYDGDLAVVRRESSYRVGDVVVYRVPESEVGAGSLVIHRVVGGSGSRGYVTQGDNREGADGWRPRDVDVVGKVRWSVPVGGRLLAFVHSPIGMASFAGLVAFALAFPGGRRRRPRA